MQQEISREILLFIEIKRFFHFLENKPVNRLFDGSVWAANFNDDSLGCSLDEVFKFGVTKLFF